MSLRGLPLVSVVSLTFNRRENICELLSMLRHQTYPSFEVIVVDNGSTDGTVEMVRSCFPEVKLIETGENLGMIAYNLGFKTARGEYILVMDDDGLPGSSDWIEQVVRRFEADPKLGAVCCTVRMRDTGRIAHDSPQFVPEGDEATGYPAVAYNGTGAGIRAVALRGGYLYPECYYRSYLELALCTNLLKRGWEVRHFPSIEVWHSRPSGSSVPVLRYYALRNYFWYVWEHYPGGAAVWETLHALAGGLKLVLINRLPAKRFLRASVAAFLALGYALKRRDPISRETLAYLRHVRRHGNWHGLAPEVRSFDPTMICRECL